MSTNFSDELVLDCRGIIFDSKANWKVIAFPYSKFFNFGEKYASTIDWNTAVVYHYTFGW